MQESQYNFCFVPVTFPTDSGTLYTVICTAYFKAHRVLPITHYFLNSIDEETKDPRGQSWHPLCSSCSRIWACWLIVSLIYFNVCVGGGLRMTFGSHFSPSPRDQTQIVGIGSKHHPLLSNLTSPITLFIFNKTYTQRMYRNKPHPKQNKPPSPTILLPKPSKTPLCISWPSPNTPVSQLSRMSHYQITVLLWNFAWCVCGIVLILSVLYVLEIIASLRNLSPT